MQHGAQLCSYIVCGFGGSRIASVTLAGTIEIYFRKNIRKALYMPIALALAALIWLDGSPSVDAIATAKFAAAFASSTGFGAEAS